MADSANDVELRTYAQSPASRLSSPPDRIWSIYRARAEKRDVADMQRWGEEMHSILIFAGLFSAVVTGFLMEGYKTLKPDLAVTLLADISQQLASLNGTQIVVQGLSPQTPFRPSPLSIAYNFLWFLSLWLSVGTALIATLVRQWLILYMQAIERPSSLRTQVHVRTYLNRGLRTFAIPYIITFAIPTLIHISMFFFFLGIVTFMYQTSRLISFTILGFQTLGLVLYFMFSILPFVRPYRSPFTEVFWFIFWWAWLQLSLIFNVGKRDSWKKKTFNDRMEEDALHLSPELSRHALRLTLDWLRDPNDFQMFVEEIPAFLQSNHAGDRSALVVRPHEDPHAVLDRVLHHLRTCHDPALWRRQRRATACIAAIWSMLVTLTPGDVSVINRPPRPFLIDIAALMEFMYDGSDTVSHYARCAVAAVLCHALRKWEVSGLSDGQLAMLGNEVKPILQLCRNASRYHLLNSLWETNLWELESYTYPPPDWGYCMSKFFVLAVMDYCIALMESPFVPAEVLQFRLSVLPAGVKVPSLDINMQGVLVDIVIEGMMARSQSTAHDGEAEWKVPWRIIEQILPLLEEINADENVVNRAKEVVRNFLGRYRTQQALSVARALHLTA